MGAICAAADDPYRPAAVVRPAAAARLLCHEWAIYLTQAEHDDMGDLRVGLRARVPERNEHERQS